MDAATRIRRGFFRLATGIGVVAALPGGMMGFALSGPPVPQGMNERAALQRELDEITANVDVPAECEPGVSETAIERLECSLVRSEAMPPRASRIEGRLQRLNAYRDQYPGAWYEFPKWLRALITTVAGAGLAFLITFGVIRAIGWVVAGFF